MTVWPPVIVGQDGEWFYVRDDHDPKSRDIRDDLEDYGIQIENFIDGGNVHLRPIGNGAFVEVRDDVDRAHVYRKWTM